MRFFQRLHLPYEEWGFDLSGQEWITEHTHVCGVIWRGVPLFLKELMVATGMVKTPTFWKHCSYRWNVRMPGARRGFVCVVLL